ncbi:MAG: hypothetical protein ACREQ9_22110 [Candidatus Binatia bacterium]
MSAIDGSWGLCGRPLCRAMLLFFVVSVTVPASASAFIYPAPRVCPDGWCHCPIYTDNVDLGGSVLLRRNSQGQFAIWMFDAGIYIFYDEPAADVSPDGTLVSIWVYEGPAPPTRKDDYCQLCSPEDFELGNCVANEIVL